MTKLRGAVEISMDKLQHMIVLETAAGEWFARMTPKERSTYQAAHPKSKYATNTSGVLAQQARGLMAKHDDLATHHVSRSERVANSPAKKAQFATHTKLTTHHDHAANAFEAAAKHFKKGNVSEGNAALRQGHHHAAKASALHDTLVSKRRAYRANRRAGVAPKPVTKPTVKPLLPNASVRSKPRPAINNAAPNKIARTKKPVASVVAPPIKPAVAPHDKAGKRLTRVAKPIVHAIKKHINRVIARPKVFPHKKITQDHAQRLHDGMLAKGWKHSMTPIQDEPNGAIKGHKFDYEDHKGNKVTMSHRSDQAHYRYHTAD